MHIVLRRETLPVRAASTVEAALRAAAAGRPLIIDFFTVRTRGRSIGDLIVGFDTDRLGPAFVEVDPIADVPVVVERRLLDVLRRGAAIVPRPWWWPFGGKFWVRMDHPEDWIGFLDERP